MSETLTETFARFAEEADFWHWRQERTAECQFVHAHQNETVWKFTVDGWWKFVTRTIRNNGAYNLPSPNQLHVHARKIAAQDGCGTIRTVNLTHWTLKDWKDELAAI